MQPVCPQCHGVYFDKGELGELIELVEDFMFVQLNEDEIDNLPEAEQDFNPACPGCGVWLDQGEMSALRATQMLICGNLNLFIRLGQ